MRNCSKQKRILVNIECLYSPMIYIWINRMQIMMFASKKLLLDFDPMTLSFTIKYIGFALIQYKNFCPINLLEDPRCLIFLHINDYQKSEDHGRKLLNSILNPFQIVIHILDSFPGFTEQISRGLGLEKKHWLAFW